MGNENETNSQQLTADELDLLFINAELSFELNWRSHVKDDVPYADLIAARKIESDDKPQVGACAALDADISRLGTIEESVTIKSRTKAEFSHRLQVHVKALAQQPISSKLLDSVILSGKALLENDRQEITQQHKRFAERVGILVRQRSNLNWFFEWGRLGIASELVGRFGATSRESRTSGLVRIEAISTKLHSHAERLLDRFDTYHKMRTTSANPEKQKN